MKRRILNEIKSTLIGLIIVGSALAFVWTERAEWSHVSGWAALGVTLILGEDSTIGLKRKGNEPN